MTADAILLASFGGPEGPEEVMPFLERVTAGRPVPRERLQQVAEHYLALGGISPINAQNRALLAALRAELDRRGVHTPLLWGNRNAEPTFAQALAQAGLDGARSVVAIATSAYSSYSGCRQYRENLAAALEETGLAASVDVRKIRPYADRPEFAAAFAAAVVSAVSDLLRGGVPASSIAIVFTTHSLPMTMARTSGPSTTGSDDGVRDDGNSDGGGRYVAEHLRVAERVVSAVAAAGLPAPQWQLAFSSRSGPPQVAWLEPDVSDALRALAADGVRAVVVVPIGFVSDHMEVVWDLDREAADVAADLGLTFRRTPTPGTDAGFVSLLADLVEEGLRDRAPDLDRSSDSCGRGCCPAGDARAAVEAC